MGRRLWASASGTLRVWTGRRWLVVIEERIFQTDVGEGNVIRAEGAIIRPIMCVSGDCSQSHFSPWPRSSEFAAGARRRPTSILRTYTANLMPVLHLTLAA